MARDFALRKRAASSSSPMTGQAESSLLRQSACSMAPGAHHDQVLTAEGKRRGRRLHHDALFEQAGNVLGSASGCASRRRWTCAPAAAQKTGRGQTGFPQPYDQNLLCL